VSLMLVSHWIGTRPVVAYALVHLLTDLTHGILHAPIDACSTLCAHAVGAGNAVLAGQYVQLAIVLYLMLNVPLTVFWWHHMRDVIVWLHWGDAVTAQLAQDYVRVLIFAVLLQGGQSAIWQLLVVTDHAAEGALLSLCQGVTEVALIAALALLTHDDDDNMTLQQVGLIFTATELLFLIITIVWSERRGWLKPFHAGLLATSGILDSLALRTMIQTAIPMAWAYLSESAEWTVLTVLASFMGPAEVAAWAILGNLWDLFYYASTGFGDKARIDGTSTRGEREWFIW